ncbi:hypothetical protein AADZ90_019250 [Aestuariibius sp. 2305UL40-4]|uniref:hypothetical protein n=1 Tax=Aestuariibius violaceus TaxID=3234132 RepID=UPI0034964A99
MMKIEIEKIEAVGIAVVINGVRNSGINQDTGPRSIARMYMAFLIYRSFLAPKIFRGNLKFRGEVKMNIGARRTEKYSLNVTNEDRKSRKILRNTEKDAENVQ